MVPTAMQKLLSGPFFFSYFMPNYYDFLIKFRNYFAKLAQYGLRKSNALQQFFCTYFLIAAVWGIPPYKFCENLHEALRRSVSKKVVEI